jgi:hypothetical protein
VYSIIWYLKVKDDEFDYLIARLDDAERRVCRFLYATQIYKKKLQLAIKKYLDTYSIDPKSGFLSYYITRCITKTGIWAIFSCFSIRKFISKMTLLELIVCEESIARIYKA